jgi:hypothetical protein
MDLIHQFNNMSVALLRMDDLSLRASDHENDPLPGLMEQWNAVLPEAGCYLSYASGCIVPVVGDADRFQRFTDSLVTAFHDGSSQEACRCLENLIRSISLSILEHRPNFSKIPHLEDQLLRLTAVAEALGMDDQADGLRNYRECLQGGLLSEYLLAAEDDMFFLPPSEPGSPASWHDSSTDSLLARRWENAMILLRALEENPEAHELSSRLRANLLRCANHSREQVAHGHGRQGDDRYLEQVIETLGSGTKS